MQVIWVYLPDFLHEQRGLTIDQSSLIVTLFGVGASAGQMLGAKMGQLAYNRHSTLQPLLMGVRNLASKLTHFCFASSSSETPETRAAIGTFSI